MSREEFEKVFPIPATMIRWDEKCQAYVSVTGRLSMTADTYNDRLRVWQAATHRIVPVELLKRIEWVLKKSLYWSNNELGRELCTIIDKEPT